MVQEYFLTASSYNANRPESGNCLTQYDALSLGAVFFCEKSIADNGNSCQCGSVIIDNQSYRLTYIGYNGEGNVYQLD